MFTLDAAAEAQAIFQQGPETVVVASQTIVAGPPSGIVVRVDKASQGASPVPLEWTVSGALGKPILIKGRSVPATATFRRREQAIFTILDSSTPSWELALGSIEQSAAVVLFYQSSDLTAPTKVLPSPRGGPDFVRLVSDIVRIQSIPEAPDRIAAWREYAAAAPSSEGRKAALRSLVASGAPWSTVAETWRRILADTQAPAEARAFAFKLMLFATSAGQWPENVRDILALARQAFMTETNARLALDFTDGFVLLQNAAVQNPGRWPGVNDALCQTLRARDTLGPDTDDHSRSLNDAYRQVKTSCLAKAPPAKE